jgi:hypothetical protein
MSSPHSRSPSQGEPGLICPYCEQDDIWEVRLKDLDQDAVMCLECDTVWRAADDVAYGKGLNFEDFMAARGREPDWGGVLRLRKVVAKPS